MSTWALTLAALLCLTVCGSGIRTEADVRSAIRRQVGGLGLTADVQGELEETLFQKVLAVIVPDIVKYARQMTIPGQSTEHFSFVSFKFSQFNIAGISITFAAPNVVTMTIQGLQLAVPQTHFDVYAKILFIKATCSGEFWVSLAPTTITVALHIATDAQGKLTFVSGASTVNFGALSINHQFKEFLCKIGQDIIQLFVGNIDTLIRNVVEKDLPAAIAPLAEKALNGAFAKLPLVVVGNPVVSTQGITLTIDLIASLPKLQQRDAPRVRIHPRDLARDLVLTAPQAAIDNLLLYITQRNVLNQNISVPPSVLNTSSIAKLIPAVAKVCADCPVDIDILVATAPTVTFGSDTVSLGVSMINIGLAALNPSKQQLPLFSINANLSLTVLNLTVRGNTSNVIWFMLNLDDFAFSLASSEIGPLDINVLSPIIAFVLKAIIIPAFNANFKGLPLPAVVNEAVLQVTPGNVVVGLDLNLV